ncbi:MAG: rod shape-determining protein RodA [Candidatus Zixiibacteriota bacterium]
MRDIDFTLVIVVVLLALIGVFAIYTATYDSPLSDKWQKQLIYFGIGLLVAILVSRISLRIHFVLAYIYYFLILLVLGFLLLRDYSVQRWINIGPFQFQPSELSKLLAVFVLARFLYDNKNNVNSLRAILGAGIIILIPFSLVMMQPDLGTAMVFSFIYIALLFRAGVRPLYILVILSPFLSIVAASHWIAWAIYFVGFLVILFLSEPGVKLFVFAIAINIAVGLATPLYWSQLHDYQKNRILIFLDQGRDPFGAGYQLIQSKIAVGSGGLWGRGFLEGTQTNLAFLPIRHSDFIFSVIAEQFGFISTIIILGLFALLLWRIYKVSEIAKNLYYQLVSFGIFSIILFQFVINIGMTIGLAPVTGLPLPFLSYGGTSLLMTFISIGLIQAIRFDRQEY